jgi:hypothetical protein
VEQQPRLAALDPFHRLDDVLLRPGRQTLQSAQPPLLGRCTQLLERPESQLGMNQPDGPRTDARDAQHVEQPDRHLRP